MILKIDNTLIKVGERFMSLGEAHTLPVKFPEPEPEPEPIPEPVNPRDGFVSDNIYKIEDIYATVQPDERIIFITRHAARGSDTSITGDLSTTGINQCKTLGAKLSNDNIDLTKTYIAGSLKYRAMNTAYQCTKAMGVLYPDDYDYILDTPNYEWLMERDFFTDSTGDSSGIDLDVNAYYSYISDAEYTGEYIDTKGVLKDGLPHTNKLPNHVDTKAQNIIDNVIALAKQQDADLAWFGTHDKVIQPLVAYVTNRKYENLHIDRTDTYVNVKLKPVPYSGYVGNWSTPLISGLAIIVNKNTDKIELYPFESGF